MEESVKPRKYDLNPDEFLAAVVGEMTPAELGVYWMICLLQYSRRGTIKYDVNWIRRKFAPGEGFRSVGPIIEKLIATGRLVLKEPNEGPKDALRSGEGRDKVALSVREVGSKRVLEEIQKATKRVSDAIEHGAKGGRPSNNYNGLDKGLGLNSEKLAEKLTTTSTTTTIKEKSLPLENLDSDSVAARGAALGATPDVSAILSQTANAISVNGHKVLTQEQKHERWVQKIWLHLCRTRPAEEVGRIVDGYSNGEPWAKAQFDEINREINSLKAKRD